MHGDSLLMLTTKVVSNKKPPLLSDSESGGSTSLLSQLAFQSAQSVCSDTAVLVVKAGVKEASFHCSVAA